MLSCDGPDSDNDDKTVKQKNSVLKCDNYATFCTGVCQWGYKTKQCQMLKRNDKVMNCKMDTTGCVQYTWPVLQYQ